jgi:cell division protein FtsL
VPDFLEIRQQTTWSMKKFKQIFYPIYLVVILLVLIMTFNIYDALELFKVWGWFKYFSDLPYMARNLLVFLCLLMVVELIAENIHLVRSRSRVKELENTIKDLKVKLYDKSLEVPDIEEESEGEDAEK